MPRTSNRSEPVAVTLLLRGQEFPFRLLTRPISLGSAGKIQYYWMDTTDFRQTAPDTNFANFRSCVGHWYAAMHTMGLEGDIERYFSSQ